MGLSQTTLFDHSRSYKIDRGRRRAIYWDRDREKGKGKGKRLKSIQPAQPSTNQKTTFLPEATLFDLSLSLLATRKNRSQEGKRLSVHRRGKGKERLREETLSTSSQNDFLPQDTFSTPSPSQGKKPTPGEEGLHWDRDRREREEGREREEISPPTHQNDFLSQTTLFDHQEL